MEQILQNQEKIWNDKHQARWMQRNSAVFNYDPSHDYVSEPSVQIGSIDKICSRHSGEKGSSEHIGLCYYKDMVRFDH